MPASDLSNLGELLDLARVAVIIRSFGSVSVIYRSRGTESPMSRTILVARSMSSREAGAHLAKDERFSRVFAERTNDLVAKLVPSHVRAVFDCDKSRVAHPQAVGSTGSRNSIPHRWLARPRVAIHGMHPWQFDAPAWLIQAVEKVHLAEDLCRIPHTGSVPARHTPSRCDTHLVSRTCGLTSVEQQSVVPPARLLGACGAGRAITRERRV